MSKRKTALKVTPLVGLSAAALTYFFWCKRHDIKKSVVEWKNTRIRNGYYDTLTEKDIAWG